MDVKGMVETHAIFIGYALYTAALQGRETDVDLTTHMEKALLEVIRILTISLSDII